LCGDYISYIIINSHTKKDYKTVWKDSDRDYWMKAEEAKAYGMVDEVLKNAPK
jgi:ATP-dependent Clp protease protease subunit